jgi:hypothetical protein
MPRKERILVVLISVAITALILLGVWSLREPEGLVVQNPPVIDPAPGLGAPQPLGPDEDIDPPVSKSPPVIPIGPEETTGGTVEGKVVDDTGKPILSAVITALRKHNKVKYAFTDENGEYAIRGLPPGAYDFRADREEYATATRRNIQVRALETTHNVDFELDLSGSFIGFVVSSAGDEPIAGANVVIYASGFPDRSRGLTRSFREKTGQEGAFQIDKIPPGDYFVHAQAAAYLPSKREAVRIEREQPVTYKFVLDLGGSVSGTVTDLEDKPVPDAQMWLSTVEGTLHLGKGAKTDADGKYVLEGLKAGTVNVRVIAQGFVTQTKKNIEVFKSQRTQGVDFRLDRGKGVSGVVVNYDGEPVKGASVSASDRLSYKTTKTGEKGAFTLRGFSGDKVNLTVRATGYVFFIKRKIPVGTEDLNLVLGRGGAIEGQVVADEPLADFVVILYSIPEPSSRPRIVKQRVSRDPQGNFKMSDIPQGSYTIKVNARALEDSKRKYIQAREESVEVRENVTITGLQIRLSQQ